MESKRFRWQRGQVTGTDPMRRIIDTGREFAPPPDINYEDEKPRLDRVGEILSEVSPEEFAKMVRSAAALLLEHEAQAGVRHDIESDD